MCWWFEASGVVPEAHLDQPVSAPMSGRLAVLAVRYGHEFCFV